MVIHLELQTQDLVRATAYYSRLCGWHPQRVEGAGGTYWSLPLGGGLGGGVVERDTPNPLWLPYVAVPDVADTTERARRLGASVLMEPREGRAGWRSIVANRTAGEVALWQPRETYADD
jgi:predicted enzyme related to lactoylglutathione lyase